MNLLEELFSYERFEMDWRRLLMQGALIVLTLAMASTLGGLISIIIGVLNLHGFLPAMAGLFPYALTPKLQSVAGLALWVRMQQDEIK